MKSCSKCYQWKDEDEFPWKNRLLGWRHSMCKICRNEYQAEYYQRTKKDWIEYKANRKIEAREVARHYVYTYLKNHPCEICGENDPLVLTFDHNQGKKKMDISQIVNQGYPIEALQKEINKCRVLCANCHMRIEKKKRGTIYWLF